VHWWDPDRLHHLDERPNFCPHCGADFAAGIAVEYWEGERSVYHCWCHDCGWTGDVVRVTRMIGHEPADD